MARVPELKRTLLGAAVALCFAAPGAHANPSGPTVVHGSASFAASGSTLTVTNAPGTIINWQQFSIQQNELTRFVQQSAASAVLNRVTGGDPSAILGTLASNGRVYLLNASGITIGAGARIDVAGFAASTLNLSDADFLAGRHLFRGTGSEGALVNAGSIRTAQGGYVYLIAPQVENQSGAVITSPGGEVVIAAGRTVELVGSHEPDIRVEFSAGGEAVNAGEIVASSGYVGIYGTLVRAGGLVSASRAELGAGGKIVFRAAGDTLVEAGARIEATGDTGGDVRVLGERVAVLNGAAIDVSGEAGGGTILVGGDFQGANPDLPNAQRTYVGADAVLKADALAEGDGGTVIVWADGDTRYYGSVSARGGTEGGQGGFVEISGKEILNFDGRVDVGAAAGAQGTILLDPRDIIIVDAAPASGDAQVADGAVLFPDGTASTDFTISDDALEALVGSIVLQATRDVTVGAALDLAQQGAGERVVLQAGRHVTVNASITTAGADIWLEADSPHAPGGADGAGAVLINAPVNSNGGKITLIGGANTQQGAVNRGGFELNADVDAGAGGIDVSLSNPNGGELSFYIGSQGQAQFTSSDTGQLKSTGTLTIGEATTAGTDGLGTNALVLKVDSLGIGTSAGGPVTLDDSAGTSVVFTAGDGGISTERELTTEQATTFDTTGPLAFGEPFTNTDGGITIVADSVSGGDQITGTITSCTGSGCPGSPFVFWDGGGGDLDWFNPLNWSTDLVPSASDDVQILTSLGTILVGAGAEAKSVIASVPVWVSGSLELHEGSQFTDLLALTGSLLGPGSVAVTTSTGLLDWSGGLIGAGDLFVVGLGASGTLTNALTLERILQNSGTLTLAGASVAGSGSIDNAATMIVAAGTANTVSVGLSNASQAILQAGALSTLAAGAFTNRGSATFDGAASIGVLNLEGGTVAGTGDLTVSADFLHGAGTLGTTFANLELHKLGDFIVPGYSAVDSLKLIASGAVILSGDLTVTAGSGDALVVAGGSFDNSGGHALQPGAGRFLVWSGDPAADDRGGLAYGFKQYNASFGDAVLGTGNGFLYTVAPVIAAGLTGTVSKVYDATTAATLAAGNYTVSGAIDGDSVTLNNPAAGLYDDRNAGSGKTVSVDGIAIAGATDGPATVFGYQLAGASASAGIGEITPAALVLAAVSDTKIYDGTTVSSGVPVASGLQGADTVADLSQSFDSPAAGARVLLVNGGFVIDDGNGGANYVVTLQSAAGTIEAIVVPPSSLTPPPPPPLPEGSLTGATMDSTLFNLNTGESVILQPGALPDPGIYLSEDSSSVYVVGESLIGGQLNVASALLFPVVTYEAGLYVNAENGFLYALEDGAVLDPGVYYNDDTQMVLVVTSNDDGTVTVSSADIKEAVQAVASGSGTRRVASVACQ